MTTGQKIMALFELAIADPDAWCDPTTLISDKYGGWSISRNTTFWVLKSVSFAGSWKRVGDLLSTSEAADIADRIRAHYQHDSKRKKELEAQETKQQFDNWYQRVCGAKEKEAKEAKKIKDAGNRC